MAATLSSFAFTQQNESLPSSLTGAQPTADGQANIQSLGDLARHVRKDHSEETKLNDNDAKKLLAAVDRISSFASEDSGMALHGPIKRRIIGPDDVEKTAREHLSNKDYSDSFARSELTMKKFGLLPRNFDLREFRVSGGEALIGVPYWLLLVVATAC